MTVKTVGLDLAKDVFQVHGISESGCVIFNNAIKRAKLLAFFEASPACTIGMEACGRVCLMSRHAPVFECPAAFQNAQPDAVPLSI